MRGAAFAPAHITGFFEICDSSDNPLRKGSRGAGICLDRGVTTRLTVRKGSAIDVRLDRRTSKAPVTRAVVKTLAPRTAVKVDSAFRMPVGQGLGMSGAGALSTALAVAEALDLPREDAVAAAHRAEVEARTGLGDVGPQSVGGMTIRLRPGCPPYGQIRSVPVDADVEVVVGIVGPAVSTKKVLSDPSKRRAINRAGRDAVDRLSRSPSLARLIELSREFAEASGLMTRAAAKALKAVDRVGNGSVSMIGNSIFAHADDTDALVRAVRRHVTEVMVCNVDNEGARVV